MRKALKYAALIVIAFFIGIQFIQPERVNPPSDSAAAFDLVAKPSPQVAEIARRACYDCHSHSTVWPWYSRVAPVSWLVANHVREGRARLNFSQWNLLSPDMSKRRLKEACEEMRKGEMPLWNYKLMHPEARITDGDVKAFCSGTEPVVSGLLRK